jgi:microcystin-dependent protein
MLHADRGSGEGNRWVAEGMTVADGSLPPDAPLLDAGGSRPHSNLQPYLTLHVVIALQGIFPPRA